MSTDSSCTGWKNSWTGCKNQEPWQKDKEAPAPKMRLRIKKTFNLGREINQVGCFGLFFQGSTAGTFELATHPPLPLRVAQQDRPWEQVFREESQNS